MKIHLHFPPLCQNESELLQIQVLLFWRSRLRTSKDLIDSPPITWVKGSAVNHDDSSVFIASNDELKPSWSERISLIRTTDVKYRKCFLCLTCIISGEGGIYDLHSHQGATERFWLQFWGALLFFVVITRRFIFWYWYSGRLCLRGRRSLSTVTLDREL